MVIRRAKYERICPIEQISYFSYIIIAISRYSGIIATRGDSYHARERTPTKARAHEPLTDSHWMVSTMNGESER